MKALLAGLPDYWLNFGLHTLLVSLFAWLACRLIRDPGRRAFFAAVGIAGIALLPWVSALRLFEKLPQPITMAQEPFGTSFPEWTIRIENADAVPPPPISIPPLVASEATPIDWIQALAIIWIVGATISLALLTYRQWKLMRWAQGQREPTDDEWENVERMDLGRDRIRVSSQVSTPCVVGFFRSLVIVPRFLFGSDMREELSWALRHEGEHLRSGDSRMAVLLSIARSVIWWNPFVHSLCAIWSEDRERVCDARATENLIDRRRYGSFLLDLSERQEIPMKGAVPMASSAGRMRKRLQAILRGDRVKEGSLTFQIISFLVIAGAGLVASFAGVGRTHAAEAPPPPAKEVASQPMPLPPEETGKQLDPQNPDKAVATSQVKVTATFLETTYEIPEAGSILGEQDRQLLMRRCAQRIGTVLVTSPSIAMRDQQKGSVEIIRTDPKATAKHGVGETRKAPFVGLSMDVQPEVIGDRLRLSIDCLFHFADETKLSGQRLGEWPATPAKDFDWSKVRAVQAKATKDMKSGETLVLAFEGEDEGRHLTGFFTATRIDATGRATDESGNVLPAPKPEWHGKTVRMRAAIIEVPADGKLGSYWLNLAVGENAKPGAFGFLYPSGHLPAIVAEARKGGADRAIELGATMISEDSPLKPWAEYGAEISGMKLTGTPVIHLRVRLPKIGEIDTSGSVGYIIGGEITPTANGKRRFLLLSFEDPEK